MRDFCFLHSLVLLCVLLAPGVAAAAAAGQIPTPYGLHYHRGAQPRLDTPVQLLRSAPDAARYRAQVEQAELANGPYSSQLAETLAAEATYLEQRGHFAPAISSFRRAVHLTRINDGLHSVMQLPLVERLFANYLAIGDLELADDMQQYLYFLRSESWPGLSTEKIAAVVELADWRRKTWLLELHDRDVRRWHESYRLVDAELDQLQALPAPPLELLELLTYALVRQLYLLGQGEFGLEEELQLALRRGFADPNSRTMSHDEGQMLRLQKGAYARGSKLLRQLSAAAVGNRRSQARAQLYLADWHTWHKRSKRARQNYQRCWQLLAAPELRHLRESWFAQPLELPLDDVFFAGRELLQGRTRWVPVQVRFTVAANGMPDNIRTQAVPEEHAALGYRLQRWLRSARYRPRLEMGVPVTSAQLTREYLVAD